MPRAPMPRPTAWPRAALAALFMAFALTALAPDNAAAQATTLRLGTVTVDVNGTDTNLNLILIRPIIATDGKLYYYLDPNDSNTPNTGDSLNHNVLNALLNGGSDTIDTLTTGTGHDGRDDERSVIVGSYALILPTVAEWTTLRNDRDPVSLSPRWPGSDFHTATLASPRSHNFFRLDTGTSPTGTPTSLYRAAFQVITLPPAAPTGVTLAPGDGQITVLWTAVSDTSTPTLTYTNTATATDTTDASNTFTCSANSRTETGCTITNLTNGTTYSVAVVTTNNHGTSDESAAVMSAPVAAPAVQTTLALGSMSDINLNLILPVTTAAGKVYYHVDHNKNGSATEDIDGRVTGNADTVTGEMVDALFNNGDDVIVTQETDDTLFPTPGAPGDHNGTEDERSVIVGRYVLILPTVNELHALSQDQGGMQPTDWATQIYRTANRNGNNEHHGYQLLTSGGSGGLAVNLDDPNRYLLAVQVIALSAARPDAAPADVTASPIADGTLRIDWAAVPAINNGGTPILTYTATATPTGTFSGDPATCTATAPDADTPPDNNCTITGLTNGTIYSIVVTATNSVDTGPASTAFTVIPGTPAAPTGVTLDPGFEKIVVTWTPVPDEDNGGADVTSYTAYPNPVGEGQLDTLACTAAAPATKCTIMGLTNNTEYRVVVRATNSRGDSIASSGVLATLSGLSLTPARIADQTLSVGQPDVTITLPSASQGIGTYSYALTRSDSGTPLLPSGLTLNLAAFTISGTPTEAFGTNGGVELVYTATDSDTPRPDIGTLTFRLTVNDDTLRLGSGFNLRYPVILNGGTANEKVYYYNDRNNNARADRPGDDASRPYLRNLLNPVAPGDPVAPVPETQPAETHPGGHDGSDDARSVIVGDYTLVLPTIAEMITLFPHRSANWSNTTYITATRADGHNIYSYFRSVSSVSLGVAWPVIFQVVSTADVPSAPTGVTALPTTDATTLRIAWTAVPTRDNGGAPITTYTATATNSGDNSDTTTCTATAAPYTCDITGLTNGTEYSVDVIATNSAGDSDRSDSVTVIPGRPAAPADVTLTPGDMQIMVTWTAVPDENNGGEAVTSYKAAADVSDTDATTHGVTGGVRGRCTATAPATTCTITGLANGVPHRVIVRATNSRGDSIASSGVSAAPVGTLGLTLTPGALTMDEGGTATYTAVLATRPTDTVTVTVSDFSGTDLATTPSSPATLTFTTTNWSAPQTFTLTAAEDADADNDSVTLTHDVTGGNYAGQTGTVMVTITDNDLAFNPDTIEDQRHNINEEVALTLPEAMGGVGTVTGTVTYTLTRITSDPMASVLAPGLTFDNLTRTITGTPTVEFGVPTAAQLVYTAADTAKTGTLTFAFRVTPVPALTLTPAALTFAEGSTTTYTAILTTQPSADVTVAIAVPDSTDLTVMTPSAGMLTFTMTNWNAAQTVTLTAAEDDDAVNEDPVTLSHTVTSTDTDYASVTGEVTVTITDTDTAALTLTPGALTFDEGGTANYTVVLDTEPSAPVTVTITGHATTDLTVMTPASGMLTFNAANWDEEQTVTLTAAEDSDTPEENDTVTLTHTAAGGDYGNVTGDVTVTIMDNDVPGLITPRSLTVVEGAAATYTVRLTIAPDADVTVAITVPEGSAGLEALSSAMLTFTPTNYDEPQNVVVTASDNDIDAADGGATLAHTATSSGNYMSGVAVRNLVLTITDDDTRGLALTPGALTFDEGGTATYTAVLDSQPTGNVTVTVAIDNTDITTIPAGDGFVFEPGNWDTPQTLTFTAAEDDDTMDDRATLTHTTRDGGYTGLDAVVLGVTVTDNDIAFAETIQDQTHNIHQPLTLTLPAATNNAGVVTYTLTRPNASPILPAGLTYGSTSASAPPTGTSADAMVTAAAPIIISGTPTQVFGVTNAAQLVYTATDSASAKTGALTFAFQVLDRRGITLNPTAVTMDEGDTETYNAVLESEPTADVTVTIESDNDDVTTTPTVLTFTTSDWSTAQTVTITDAEIDVDTANDTANLTHVVAGGDYANLTVDNVVVTVIDDDAPNLRIMPTSLTLAEGVTATYTVGLTTSPDAAVTVTVGGFTSTDDVALTPTVLTFTTIDWRTAQTVTIVVAEDDDAVPDDTVTLTHTVASSGNYMTGVAVRNLSVTITENDTVGLNLMPATLTLNEGGTATYTVVLDSVPDDDVTVAISSSDNDVTPTPAALTFTTTDWETAQTVNITTSDDTGQHSAVLTHTVTGGFYGLLEDVLLTVNAADTITTPPMFSATDLANIAGQTRRYEVNKEISLLTLPAATGGAIPLSYRLAPLPTGLAFNNPTARTISGTPTMVNTHVLTYTVTDSAAPPQTVSVTFNVMVVVEQLSPTDGTATTVTLNLPSATGTSASATTVLVTLPAALTVSVGVPLPSVPGAPSGIEFTSTVVDIALSDTFDGMAEVCLPTTGVPDDREPVLYHYPSMGDNARTWTEIGRNTEARPGFVCGMTRTFSTFGAGWETTSSRLTTISEIILPEVARAMTDNTVRAITQRFDQARTARQTDTAASAFTLGGQSTLADVLRTGGQALADGTLNMNNILGNSAFVLPLSSGGGVADTLTLWGSGGYSGLGGGGGGAMDWDGNLVSAHLGADAQIHDTLLAGAAISWNQGDFDYGALTESPKQGGGNYAIEMTSITPYAEWAALPDDRLNIWGTAGYGEGEVTIIDNMVAAQTNDTSMVLWGGGASGRILKNDAGELRLKSEVMQTQLSVAGGGNLADLTVEARRMRVSLAGTTTHTLADGAHLTPTIEVGMRNDSGSGRTGTGAEVGGGVRYAAPVHGITFESRSRVLLGHTGDYDDWGIGGALAWNTGQGGQGLALRLAPTYGQTQTQTAQLWDQGAMDLTGTDAAALGQRMDAEVGYGLTALDGQGLLTPYSKMTWGQGARAYRLGSRLTLASGLTMSFEGVRGETLGATAPAHHLQWQTGWRWLTASMQASGVERRMQLQAEWQW